MLSCSSSNPGKPTQNAFIESLNDRVRSGVSNAQWFPHVLPKANDEADVWMTDRYNTTRTLTARSRILYARGVPRDLRNYPTSTRISGRMTGLTYSRPYTSNELADRF